MFKIANGETRTPTTRDYLLVCLIVPVLAVVAFAIPWVFDVLDYILAGVMWR